MADLVDARFLRRVDHDVDLAPVSSGVDVVRRREQIEEDLEALYLPASRRNTKIAASLKQSPDQRLLIALDLSIKSRLVFAPECFDPRFPIKFRHKGPGGTKPAHIRWQVRRQFRADFKIRRALSCQREGHELRKVLAWIV